MSGKLIMNALVMYDRQSGTLWSQFLSRGVEGKHAGRKLEVIPVMLTTWAAWKAEFPDSKVLDKRGRFSFDPYDSYYASDRAGVIGRTNRDSRLPVKEMVLGVGFEQGPKAYPHSILAQSLVVNDVAAGTGIVVWFDPGSGTATAFESRVNGTTLSFDTVERPSGPNWLKDRETGSVWSPLSGRAVEGPLAGERLVQIHAMNAFWFAWADFYPGSEIFEG